MNSNPHPALRVVMMGATGAVGGCVLSALQRMPQLAQLTLLGRRTAPQALHHAVRQHAVEVMQPSSYRAWLPGHEAAICTLGVGQPSKMSMQEFVALDKDAVLDFARACREAGVRHFELLSSVGVSAQSRSLYLRAKGELCDALQALGFERLSIFQPSMILTPINRYGLAQGVLLATWPLLSPLLQGGLRNYRGIAVQTLGEAMAANLLTQGAGTERLYWSDFNALAKQIKA